MRSKPSTVFLLLDGTYFVEEINPSNRGKCKCGKKGFWYFDRCDVLDYEVMCKHCGNVRLLALAIMGKYVNIV